MVRCKFCVFYADGVCVSSGGRYFNVEEFNPNDDIDCDSYIDNGIVMGLIPNDGMLDDMF